MLAAYQKDFLRAALAVTALKFGDFTLKSGRQSPYFFNAGAFASGEALTVMARAYAATVLRLREAGIHFDALYGPAYKGIPLVASVAVVLHAEHGLSLPWTFNRKEAKDHGEGGTLVGAPLAGKRVLILDDVPSANRLSCCAPPTPSRWRSWSRLTARKPLMAATPRLPAWRKPSN